MRIAPRVLLAIALVAVLLVASSAQAVVYQVDRTFSDGFGTATLTGTVSVPLGNYVIQNMAPNPFTDVNLTLTVNAVPFSLMNALTGKISGTGQFTVDATATELIFSASGNGANPADLVFSDNFDPNAPNRYVIGSDGIPSFQTASTESGFVSVQPVPFPNVFGIAVPEPSSLVLWTLAVVGAGWMRRR
jgi:hypothetical protein